MCRPEGVAEDLVEWPRVSMDWPVTWRSCPACVDLAIGGGGVHLNHRRARDLFRSEEEDAIAAASREITMNPHREMERRQSLPGRNGWSGRKGPSQARLLVAEDHEGIREILRVVLTRQGYAVDVCRDGVEAERRAAGQSYDLLISDVQMPGLGGIELVRELRSRAPELPVILMSAGADEDPDSLCDQLGLVAFLLKPFPLASLVSLVAEVVGSPGAQATSGMRK